MLESRSSQSCSYRDRISLLPIEERELYLRDTIGLGQEKIAKLKEEHGPALYPVESIQSMIIGLTERGFRNPSKMIKFYPEILGLSFGNIDKKITDLEDRGFRDSRRMIKTFPTILGYDIESIDKKIIGLGKRGFTDPYEMIESWPRILGISLKKIDRKTVGLKKRGFLNPRKMIESSPAIIGYDLNTVDKKIVSLKQSGFVDVIGVVESFPTILGLSIRNVSNRIKLISRINSLYNLGIDPVATIESNLSILGMKLEKIFLITRILRDYKPSPETIKAKIGTLSSINIESLLISYSRRQPSDSIIDLIKVARNIQKEKIPEKEKKQIIDDFFSNNVDIKKYIQNI